MKWRINSITLQNFKYIHNAYTLPLNGKNLLVYGENGSGKSIGGKTKCVKMNETKNQWKAL